MDPEKQIDASDALYGFVAWLTTRDEVTHMGAGHDCAPVMDVLKTFMDANHIGDPSPGYPETFVIPGSVREVVPYPGIHEFEVETEP